MHSVPDSNHHSPTTTIGSFPQTKEIRSSSVRYKKVSLNDCNRFFTQPFQIMKKEQLMQFITQNQAGRRVYFYV
ncbi:MAG: hypothetical protein JW915_18860 [Chitinispirillaceae bacterium]|nr:hypothetical protein [Chitinispirillaceae bacterium]